MANAVAGPLGSDVDLDPGSLATVWASRNLSRGVCPACSRRAHAAADTAVRPVARLLAMSLPLGARSASAALALVSTTADAGKAWAELTAAQQAVRSAGFQGRLRVYLPAGISTRDLAPRTLQDIEPAVIVAVPTRWHVVDGAASFEELEDVAAYLACQVTSGRIRSWAAQLSVGVPDASDRVLAAAAQRLRSTYNATAVAIHPWHGGRHLTADAEQMLVERGDRLAAALALAIYHGMSLNDLQFRDGSTAMSARCQRERMLAALASVWPADVLTAPINVLARVPGIGVEAAGRVIALREANGLRRLEDLGQCGVDTRTAGRWIRIGARRCEVPLQAGPYAA